MRRSRVRIGAAARRRIADGGPLSTHRPAVSLQAWENLKQQLLSASDGACERCGARGQRLDPEHAIERSKGGADTPDNIWIACATDHALKSNPYKYGRLLVVPLGDQRFDFKTVIGTKQRHDIITHIIYDRIARTWTRAS